MAETLAELEARHERELEELEDKKTAHIDAAKALGKGKKAKAAIDAAEREADTWEYELRERHREELENLEAGGEEAEDATATQSAVADVSITEAKETNAEESEAARAQRKKEKAAKKREKGLKKNEAAVDSVPTMSPLPNGLKPPDLAGARSPTMAGLRSPSQRWQDDPVSVEDLAPSMKLEKPDFEIIEGVQPFSEANQTDPRMKAILDEVSVLSKDAFEEDALHMVTRKARWKLTLLVRPEGATCSEAKTNTTNIPSFSLDPEENMDDEMAEPPLIGFIIYRLKPEHEAFSIAKLAVVPEHRGKGHGGRLMKWAKDQVKKQKDIRVISLSSLPDAVRFYNKLGFRAIDVSSIDWNLGEDEQLVEGQVYMELEVRKGGRKKK